MPATAGTRAGVKLLMVQPANGDRNLPLIDGAYVLFDSELGRPIALLDGSALTRLRTPAASAVATDALARREAASLGIIGAGPQGLAHLEAMLCVRPAIASVIVSSRSASSAQTLVTRISDDDSLTGLSPRVRSNTRFGSYEDAAACDIVCIATRSTTALVDLPMVRPGAHLNAVGAYRPDMAELAADLLSKATVTVDEIGAAREEAGDLIRAAATGAWSWAQIAGDLVALANGTLKRSNVGEVTVFKSVGLALEDLVVADLVAAASGV